MNDTSAQWPRQFVISYGEDELVAFRKSMAVRIARGRNQIIAFGVPLAVLLAFVLMVLAMFKLGVIEPAALWPTLTVTCLAFATGVASYYLLILYDIRAFLRTYLLGGAWHYRFADDAVFYHGENKETRLAWHAIKAVEDVDSLVAFRLDWRPVFVIPARIFADDADRANFIAIAAARIKAASQSARLKPMNGVSPEWPRHFVFTYSDDELRAYRKIAAKQYAGGRRRIVCGAILLAGLFALFLALFAMFQLGFVKPAAVRSVLVIAYLAFVTGVTAYYLVMLRDFRTFPRSKWHSETWHYSFDDDGVCFRSEAVEGRLAWRAVNAVEDLGRLIAFRFGPHAIMIPSRL